jgi:hypothetical protein
MSYFRSNVTNIRQVTFDLREPVHRCWASWRTRRDASLFQACRPFSQRRHAPPSTVLPRCDSAREPRTEELQEETWKRQYLDRRSRATLRHAGSPSKQVGAYERRDHSVSSTLPLPQAVPPSIQCCANGAKHIASAATPSNIFAVLANRVPHFQVSLSEIAAN